MIQNNCYYCYFCGDLCTDKYHTKDYLKKTFTELQIVKSPNSEYVCGLCAFAFSLSQKIKMVDNEEREGHPRNYSWVISKNKYIAATKAHLEQLREFCFGKNIEIPFKIALADSGQKHVLYKAPWNYETNRISVQLENQTITYNIQDLKERIEYCKKLIAPTGKKALLEPISWSFYSRIYEYYGDYAGAESLESIKDDPLTMLSVWLSPNKETCQDEYKRIDTGNDTKEIGGVSVQPTQLELF